MDDKRDPVTIRMENADSLDTPLLQVTHDEESGAATNPVAATTTPPPPTTTTTANDDNGGRSSNAIHVHNTITVQDQVARGEKQPNQYRDGIFAVLFVLHLGTVCTLGFAWGIPALREGMHQSTTNTHYSDDTLSLTGVLGLCLVSTVAAIMLIFGALCVMIQYADILIQGSLCLSIGVALVFAIGFAVEGFVWASVVYFLVFFLSLWYAYSVWRRIPFAKANLVTATTVVKSNVGIMVVAFGMVIAMMIWVTIWTLSATGILMRTRSCDDSTGQCEEDGPVGAIATFFLILSFYWTMEVIKNVLVVTVAGVVGTWWFAPDEANALWSPAITDSFCRATTYSFGSICLGSLVMAIIQVLHQMVHEARRNNGRNSLLLCILECIVAFLERLAEYFNRYANIYVGLYGYEYMTAGKKVMELFRNRGWTNIINDNLVFRTLALINFVVGALTGAFGMAIANLFPSWVEVFGDNQYIASFALAFVIGLSLSHVVLGVIASATDTVIVCFAESPNDFQANYPELSQQMLFAWRQIYPNECGF